MVEYSFHIPEATIYGYQIGPHPYSFEQTLRDQPDVSCVAQITRNDQAKEYSLSKQRENYDLAHQYILEESYKRTGERAAEYR